MDSASKRVRPPLRAAPDDGNLRRLHHQHPRDSRSGGRILRLRKNAEGQDEEARDRDLGSPGATNGLREKPSVVPGICPDCQRGQANPAGCRKSRGQDHLPWAFSPEDEPEVWRGE
eukprot:GHVR01153441.1.p2 GENE.GHVR01153441.1~~GHVR01153441.1.p2  ORF type:complete len:116 (+),score=4.59 GHVR01153441.1:158-505(+)